jgi:hypothetical protein
MHAVSDAKPVIDEHARLQGERGRQKMASTLPIFDAS